MWIILSGNTMDKNNMPKRWEWKKLGEVAEIIMGQSPPSNTYTEKQEGLPFFQGKAEFGARFPEVRKYCSKPVRIAGQNNILMSVRAPVGSLNIADQKCCIGRGLCAIKSLQKLDYLFLYHFLKSIEKEISSKGEGSTFTAINRKDIERIEIPVPPLPTQRKIVSILERAEKLKNLRKEANGETNTIIQALFYEMFGDPVRNEKGWDVKKLEEVCEKLFAGGDVPKDNFSKEKTEEYSVPIYSNGIDEKALYGFTNIRKVTKPSITISGRGTIGYSAIRTGGFYPIIRLIVATPNEKIINILYLNQVIKNLKIQNTGTSIPQLTVPMIKKNNVPVPPISLQNQFAYLVEKIESVKEKQTQSSKEINTLFDALMQKAFNGELA